MDTWDAGMLTRSITVLEGHIKASIVWRVAFDSTYGTSTSTLESTLLIKTSPLVGNTWNFRNSQNSRHVLDTLFLTLRVLVTPSPDLAPDSHGRTAR